MKSKMVVQEVQEVIEFAEYVKTFYGEGGVYPIGATTEMIAKSTQMYFDSLTEEVTWGGGDSIDRERVRDIMIEEFKLEWK